MRNIALDCSSCGRVVGCCDTHEDVDGKLCACCPEKDTCSKKASKSTIVIVYHGGCRSKNVGIKRGTVGWSSQ
ncbi:MAG: hypothetical protein OEV93_03760 [Candidatus Moranbacteria bacterium]|nr:hypothetical protein [Candidatus Moranbacteria bacterium]